MNTLDGNVICEGEAPGGESGVDRVFRAHFEHT
jgi:hypothetical protein